MQDTCDKVKVTWRNLRHQTAVSLRPLRQRRGLSMCTGSGAWVYGHELHDMERAEAMMQQRPAADGRLAV